MKKTVDEKLLHAYNTLLHEEKIPDKRIQLTDVTRYSDLQSALDELSHLEDNSSVISMFFNYLFISYPSDKEGLTDIEYLIDSLLYIVENSFFNGYDEIPETDISDIGFELSKPDFFKFYIISICPIIRTPYGVIHFYQSNEDMKVTAFCDFTTPEGNSANIQVSIRYDYVDGKDVFYISGFNASPKEATDDEIDALFNEE